MLLESKNYDEILSGTETTWAMWLVLRRKQQMQIADNGVRRSKQDLKGPFEALCSLQDDGDHESDEIFNL